MAETTTSQQIFIKTYKLFKVKHTIKNVRVNIKNPTEILSYSTNNKTTTNSPERGRELHKSAPYLRLKNTRALKFQAFSYSVPGKPQRWAEIAYYEGDPLGFVNVHTVAKYQNI